MLLAHHHKEDLGLSQLCGRSFSAGSAETQETDVGGESDIPHCKQRPDLKQPSDLGHQNIPCALQTLDCCLGSSDSNHRRFQLGLGVPHKSGDVKQRPLVGISDPLAHKLKEIGSPLVIP